MTDLKPEDLARLQRIAERATGMHGADQEHIIDVANEFSDAFGVETVLSLLADRARMEKALEPFARFAEASTCRRGRHVIGVDGERGRADVYEHDFEAARQALGAPQ